MRLKILLPCLTVALLAAAGMTIWSGCDVGSATEKIQIDPSDVTLSKGQSQTFTVSGGYEYQWTLDPDNGTASLSPRTGDTVTFTLLSSSSSSSNGASVVKVGCTSFIPGAPAPTTGTNGTGTATAGYTASASANVNILNALVLSPGSATIAAGSSMGLVASGGSGSYVWSVSGLGTLSPTAGGSVTFTAGSIDGPATITVTDSDGLTASCTVTITPSGGGTVLTIDPPGPITVNENTHQNFTVIGGTAPFSWLINGTYADNGHLDPASGMGRSVTYYAPATTPADVIKLYVTDSATPHNSVYVQIHVP